MELQTAKGVRDIPPEEKILKNKVMDTLREVFELYGFMPLETPILERFETLAAKGGAGADSDVLKETFTLKDQGDRKLALRFELTTSLARYAGMNPTLKMPFKRYEMGQVFRDGPIKLGRYREFWQCDIDTIGSASLLADAEILGVVNNVFKKLDLNIIIKINNRKLLNGILEQAGIKEKESAIIALDKYDKIGPKGVISELEQRGYSAKQIDSLFKIVTDSMSLEDLQKKINNEEGLKGIKELEELFGYLKTMKIENAVFDVSLARGLGYYTGTVFEVYCPDSPVNSSLAGGGRWDNMIAKLVGNNNDIPAVGLAFGLEPIMDTLKSMKKATTKTASKVYVLPIGTITESLKIVQQLREKDIAADFCLGKKGVSKNLDYASTLGIPYVMIIGDNELAKKKVLLRDMNDGTEQLLTLNDAIKKLK
ncbi:histidine--tRNA ligase [Candidatus Woesearchaeota archaeon]|nr:histidine--tRNA ligase [Candidatus Woesearchaeota archaeon]